MPKFRLKIHGAGYRVLTGEKAFFIFTRKVWKRGGFYTTRFVEAESEDDAISTIFQVLNEEFAENSISITDESGLELERIILDEKGYDLYAPGGGFTFYLDDDD